MEKGLAEERKDELALIVETANTKLIQIINDSVMFAYNKIYAKSLVNNLCDETKDKLEKIEASDYLINNTILALKKRFMVEWLNVIEVLKKIENKGDLGIVGKTIAQMQTNTPLEMKGLKGITIDIVDNGVGIANAHITNLRDFMTDNRLGGSQRYIDYTGRISQAFVNIKDKLADGSLTLKDSLGRTKSIRNMAEIETRYKMISEDLSRQGVKQNEFVVASAHANASERCSFWQGKIFIVDLDINSRPMGQYKGGTPSQTIKGYIDGKPYYSLLEACENGFLSFNCQHRLIKYYKGIRPPQYSANTINTLRNETIRQRQMENYIRKYKRREKLANTPEERSKAIAKSKEWQRLYENYSRNHGLPRYEWRTRITEYEEL